MYYTFFLERPHTVSYRGFGNTESCSNLGVRCACVLTKYVYDLYVSFVNHLRITISIFVLLVQFVDDFRTTMLYTRNTYYCSSKLLKGLRKITRTPKTAIYLQSPSEHDDKKKKCTNGNVVVTSSNYFCWNLVALYGLYCVSYDDIFFDIICI